MTSSAAPAGRPAGRYSRATRKRSRWWYWGLLSVVILAGVVIAAVGYVNLGDNPINAQVVAFKIVDDHTVTTTLTVDRDHSDQAADCIVDAPAEDGTEMGRVEVYVPPSESTATVNATLRTVKRAMTVEVYGCSYDVPGYLTASMRPSG